MPARIAMAIATFERTVYSDRTPFDEAASGISPLPPEQVRGQDADHRADIFAFGAILYEMLSRKQAFGGGSVGEMMSAILKEEPPEINDPLSTVIDVVSPRK